MFLEIYLIYKNRILEMRYIKKYKIFEDSDYKIFESTELDLKEILLELKDMGYRIIYEDDVKVLLDPTDERDVTGKPGNVKAIIVRDLMRPSDWIDLPWSELKEYALRIKDYLGDKYLSFQWRKVVNDKTGENPYKTIELNEETEINDRVWSFVIKYKE